MVAVLFKRRLRRVAVLAAAVSLLGTGLTRALRVDAATTLNPAGAWSTLENWPLIAIHAAVTGDGKVVTYGTNANGQQTGKFIYDVWTPNASAAAGHSTLPNGTKTDLFCNVQIIDSTNGQLVMFGGDVWNGSNTLNAPNQDTVTYSPATSTLTQGAQMQRPRWYASAVTLLNGDIYVQGGSGGTDRAEVWHNGASRLLPFDTSGINWFYPRMFVQPDSSVFGIDTNGTMFTVDPTLTTLTTLGKLDPSLAVNTWTAVQFAPRKVLIFGGSTTKSFIVDTTSGAPVVQASGNLSTNRHWVNGSVLPDGRVVATGGSASVNVATDANNSAEVWDPSTGTWAKYGNGAVARLYHSTSLLLPDGRVLVAGGGAPGPLTNMNAELYSPSYLVTTDGSPVNRPTINSISATTAKAGSALNLGVTSASAIKRVTLVKTGSVTHSVNFDQRFVELPFTASGANIQTTLPAGGTLTPGSYLLSILDTLGVPSVSKIISVAPGQSTPTGAPMQVGPAGAGLAGGSSAFNDLPAGATITGVKVWSGQYVNGVQLMTTAGSQPVRGAATGTLSTITLAAGESLVSVFGGSGWWIDRIGFTSSTGRAFGPFGGNGGAAFDLRAPVGTTVVGLFGSASSTLLDKIGLYAADAPAPPPPTDPQPTQVGPAGGGLAQGSAAFSDLPNGATITGIKVWSGQYINGIQVLTSTGPLPVHGASTGTLSTITLAAGETLTSVSGRAGAWLDRISFGSSTGRMYGPYGGRGGTRFTLRAPVGTSIVGLFGSANTTVVDKIGLYTR
jgi:Domain of unknown function (DUF1929)/Jacalin-like lectin domain/Kelch motif